MRSLYQYSGIFFLALLLLLTGYPGNSRITNSYQCITDTSKNYDTLTVMYAASNYVYYYDNELSVDEKSNNFHQTTNKGIKDVLLLYTDRSKKKGEKLLVILKIQAPEKLNAYSKAAIALLKANYFYKEEKFNEVEPLLISMTEEAAGIKSQ